jgi:hypothetical protein
MLEKLVSEWSISVTLARERILETTDAYYIANGLRIWHGGATALFDSDGSSLPAMKAF